MFGKTDDFTVLHNFLCVCDKNEVKDDYYIPATNSKILYINDVFQDM